MTQGCNSGCRPVVGKHGLDQTHLQGRPSCRYRQLDCDRGWSRRRRAFLVAPLETQQRTKVSRTAASARSASLKSFQSNRTLANHAPDVAQAEV
jgi:hypothetical protein